MTPKRMPPTRPDNLPAQINFPSISLLVAEKKSWSWNHIFVQISRYFYHFGIANGRENTKLPISETRMALAVDFDGFNIQSMHFVAKFYIQSF